MTGWSGCRRCVTLRFLACLGLSGPRAPAPLLSSAIGEHHLLLTRTFARPHRRSTSRQARRGRWWPERCPSSPWARSSSAPYAHADGACPCSISAQRPHRRSTRIGSVAAGRLRAPDPMVRARRMVDRTPLPGSPAPRCPADAPAERDRPVSANVCTPMARCCPHHGDWRTLARPLCDDYADLPRGIIVLELARAREAGEFFRLELGDALDCAELIVRLRVQTVNGTPRPVRSTIIAEPAPRGHVLMHARTRGGRE